MIKLKDILSEDLRKWFGKGKQGGVGGGGWDRYDTSGNRVGKCGDAKEGEPYSACLSKEKAEKLGKSGRAAFVKRKRAAQNKGGDSKKGGEHTKGQKPIKVKTGINEIGDSTAKPYNFKSDEYIIDLPKDVTESIVTQESNSIDFLQYFENETGVTGNFKYIGTKNNERVYTMPLEDLGDLRLIINDAVLMARVADDYAYFGVIYTLSGLEQFDATVLLLKKTEDGIVSKEFDDTDPDFSDAKTKFATLIKIMVNEEIVLREYTPSNPADIDKAIRDIEKLGVRNPLNPKEIIIDNSVVIEVQNWDKRLWFSSLYSIEKGKGNASRIMKKIIDIADKYKVTIALDPHPFGTDSEKLNRSQLVNFYKKFGFNFEDGEEDFGDMERVTERLNLFLEKNIPTDPAKWAYYKAQAKKKFDVYPSAYANGWAAKKYKEAGGGWRKTK